MNTTKSIRTLTTGLFALSLSTWLSMAPCYSQVVISTPPPAVSQPPVIQPTQIAPSSLEVKGLEWITKGEKPKKKSEKRQINYHYRLVDGCLYTTTTEIKGVQDLRRFDDRHPRLATGRDVIGCGGAFLTAVAFMVGQLL